MKREVLNYLVITAMVAVAALTSCNEHDEYPTEFTVTFETGDDENSVASQKVKEGEKVIKPNDLTRRGYTFVAWFKEAEWNNEWKFDIDVVTADVTLYAKWISDDNETDITNIRNKFLVDKIYYKDNLLAEYIYDNNNNLTKRIVADQIVEPHRTIERRWENEFEYENGRVAKIKTYNFYFDDSSFGGIQESNTKTTFEYNSRGELIKKNGQDLNYRYENGRFVGFLSRNDGSFFYTDTMVYDNSGNVIQHINISPESNMFGEPIAGTTRRNVRYYEYDDKPRPNFGLDCLFVFSPYPYTEAPEFIRALSKNNMTKASGEGYAYIYTYNENGLPATIGTKWLGGTSEPIPLKIIYKQIE